MNALWLAVLAPAWGANIKTVPLEVLNLPVTGPAASVKNPLVAGSDHVLPADPALRAALPELKTNPVLLEARAGVPALAADVKTADPAAQIHQEMLPPAQGVEKSPETGAKETAEDLVRRLLKKNRDEREELASVFDGEAALAAVGLEQAVNGAISKTRHGEYTLAFSEVSEEGSSTVLLERWEGPEGGLWLKHKRGLSSWSVQEFRGKTKPFKGLPFTSHAEFEVTAQRRMWGIVETAPDGKPSSVMINAKKAFKDAAEYLDGQYEGIKGSWVYGTNLAIFNKLTAEGKSPEEAALGTWTGRQAAALGYTKVVFSGEGLKELQSKKPGEYEKMSALFLRP